MIPCIERPCPTDIQRNDPSDLDPVPFRGLSQLQLGLARHLVTVHGYSPGDAAAVSHSWTD